MMMMMMMIMMLVQIRMMYLALTYDHRIIDGREAVQCLKFIADQIESPESLLMNL